MEDDDVIPFLTCHIETEFTGPTIPTLEKWCADTLRKLADRIEKGEFEDGFYDVTDNVGKKVGELYMSYDGETI